MSRTPSVDAAVVAARLQAGETRAEIAQRVGTAYAKVAEAARRWQRLSGQILPRTRRVRIKPDNIKTVTPRMQAVVAAYRPEGVTLRQVGAQFGKTAEWVRVQLNAYEEVTGERIPRMPRGTRRPRPTIPRTLWRYSDCGQRRDLTTAQAKLAPKRCRACANAHVACRAISSSAGSRLARRGRAGARSPLIMGARRQRSPAPSISTFGEMIGSTRSR